MEVLHNVIHKKRLCATLDSNQWKLNPVAGFIYFFYSALLIGIALFFPSKVWPWDFMETH